MAVINLRPLTVTLLIIVLFFSGCSFGRSRKEAGGLLFIREGHAYQVRVRTGNLAIDKIVYSFAYSEFGRYLPVSEKGPFTGYIEIKFASKLNKLFREPAPGYLTNVEYGDNWYTGEADINPGISAPLTMETEVAPGGLLAWQNSLMFVTVRNIKGKKLWSAEYNYRGSRDLSVIMTGTADDAARVCIGRIIFQFENDYGIKPRLTELEKKPPPQAALVIRKKQEPGRWADAGKTPEGSVVHVDSGAISYPSAGIVRTTASTVIGDNKVLELYEIDCPQKKFRILDQYSGKGPLSSPYTTKWTPVSRESAQELIFNYVCRTEKVTEEKDKEKD